MLIEVTESLRYLTEIGGISFQLLQICGEVLALFLFDEEVFILQQVLPLLRNRDYLVEEIVDFGEHLVFRLVNLGHFPFNFLLFSVYFLVQLLAELVEVSQLVVDLTVWNGRLEGAND